MQFRQLRYFVGIVEAGSFSKAANVVHVAQPALSQQVAELEERFAVLLLRRSARGVRPTAAGEILYKEAKALLQQLDRLPEMLRSSGGEIEGTINLGIAISLVPKIAGGVLEVCQTRLPKVTIRLADGDSLSLERRVSSAALHLAVAYEDGLTAQVVRKPLFRQSMYVVSRNPLPGGKDTISLEELSKMPLVLPAPGNGRRDLIDRAFADKNLVHNVALEADSASSEMWAVRNNIGCTILPLGDMSHFGPHAFAKPVLIEPALHLTCSIIHSGNLPLTRAAEAVHGCLVKFIERRVKAPDMPGAEWIAKN